MVNKVQAQKSNIEGYKFIFENKYKKTSVLLVIVLIIALSQEGVESLFLLLVYCNFEI